MLRSSVAKLVTRQGRALSTTTSKKILTPALLRQQQVVRCFASASGGSLFDSSNKRGIGHDQPWQAEGALDIQRVTQQAMIHELIQQQTNTIQKVVPWFLSNMPPAYFRQVPEKFRVDHIKAIAGIEGKYSEKEKSVVL